MKYVKAFGNWLLILITLVLVGYGGLLSWQEANKVSSTEKIWWVEPIVTPTKYCASITVQCSEEYPPFRNELPCLQSEAARDSAIDASTRIILESNCKILAVDLYER